MRDIRERSEVRSLSPAHRAGVAQWQSAPRAIRLQCSENENRACATGLTGRVLHGEVAGSRPASGTIMARFPESVSGARC